MSDNELSPIERLKKQMANVGGEEPKEGATAKVTKKKETPAKSTVAKKKTTAAKKTAKKKTAKKGATSAEKPIKVAKKSAKAPAKKAVTKKSTKKSTKTAKKAPVKAMTSREMVRDRKGDGLTPIERQIIDLIADSDEPVSVVSVGRQLFGEDCPSEGGNSFRTIRNGLRFPVKYGVVDMVKGERGLYKIGVAYKRSKGNLTKLAERYRARVAKEQKAS